MKQKYFLNRVFVSVMLISSVICLLAMPTVAMADQGWSTGDYFTFTPEQFGEKLNSILDTREYEAHTLITDSGVVQTVILQVDGTVSDVESVAATITYMPEDQYDSIKDLAAHNVTTMLAFIYGTEKHPERLSDICKSMIQTVDPPVPDDQAKYIFNKIKVAPESERTLYYNGAGYELIEAEGDSPAGFFIVADGIKTDFSGMPQIPRKAVNNEGFCVAFGELLEMLEELLTDKDSAFYAGPNCWFEDTSADAASGKFESIHCGATSFLISGYSKASDHIVESDESFDMVTVGIILENGESNIKDLTSVLSAVMYLTNDELTDAQSAEQFCYRVIGDGPDNWTQTGAIEYDLSSVIGTIMIFSVREINAYKNT